MSSALTIAAVTATRPHVHAPAITWLSHSGIQSVPSATASAITPATAAIVESPQTATGGDDDGDTVAGKEACVMQC